MLIGELAKAAGVSRDTIRFYVRLGLLEPKLSTKGGGNPYKDFSEDDLGFLRMLQVAQSFGMTLSEIKALRIESGPEGLNRERRRQIIAGRLAKLEAQAEALHAQIERLRDVLSQNL